MRGAGTMPADRQPSAAAVTARAMTKAAPGPKRRVEATAAGCATLAISAGGNRLEEGRVDADVEKRHEARPEDEREREGCARGLATSPATATISFQP